MALVGHDSGLLLIKSQISHLGLTVGSARASRRPDHRNAALRLTRAIVVPGTAIALVATYLARLRSRFSSNSRGRSPRQVGHFHKLGSFCYPINFQEPGSAWLASLPETRGAEGYRVRGCTWIASRAHRHVGIFPRVTDNLWGSGRCDNACGEESWSPGSSAFPFREPCANRSFPQWGGVSLAVWSFRISAGRYFSRTRIST